MTLRASTATSVAVTGQLHRRRPPDGTTRHFDTTAQLGPEAMNPNLARDPVPQSDDRRRHGSRRLGVGRFPLLPADRLTGMPVTWRDEDAGDVAHQA